MKNKPEELADLMTQSDAAKLRGVTREAIGDLIRRGRLRTQEMFGKVLVYRSEILSLEKQKPGPKGPRKAKTVSGRNKQQKSVKK